MILYDLYALPFLAAIIQYRYDFIFIYHINHSVDFENNFSSLFYGQNSYFFSYLINPFVPNAPFLYLLKTSENLPLENIRKS